MSTPTTPALTAVTQDYLKVVWSAREWVERPVTTKLLASRLGVGRLHGVGDRPTPGGPAVCVTHEPYGAVDLTDGGRRHALAMVRRHRLVETFLVEVLGYGWDEVHDEAEVLEHAVSDLFVERIAHASGSSRAGTRTAIRSRGRTAASSRRRRPRCGTSSPGTGRSRASPTPTPGCCVTSTRWASA